MELKAMLSGQKWTRRRLCWLKKRPKKYRLNTQ